MKCKKKKKVTGGGKVVFGVSEVALLTVRAVCLSGHAWIWLGSWSVYLAKWSRVAQIRDAVMLLGDVVEVWQGRGQAGPDRGQTEARGKDQGQEPTQRVEPLCRIPVL